MKKAIKNTLAVSAGALAVTGAAIAIPYAVTAWGDSTYLETGVAGSHRQFYTLADINSGKLGNTVTFNSITDVAETGDERYFTSVQEAGPDGKALNPNGTWNGGNITVEDGKEYVVRLYVHNNNPGGKANMSTGTKVAISGIGQSKTNKDGQQEVEVNGFIESDNATPKEYWDYVRFRSNTSFHLDYVYGSAMIYNRGATGTTDPISSADMPYKTDAELAAQKVTGKPLSDDIVLKAKENGELDGQLIGFDALDGNVPGCYQYSSYITIRVKAVFDAPYTVEKKVRKLGEKEWHESVDAEIGEKVEFQIEYNNTSTETQTNVMIRDILPGNLKYVANTTKLYNSNYPNWATLTPDGDIVTRGVNIGSYLGSADGKGGGNAFVRFTAEVVDTDLACGENFIYNWGQASYANTLTEDRAMVRTNKVCAPDPVTPTPDVPTTDTPNSLPNTGPMAVAGGVIATSSIVTAAGYFLASRKQLR